MQVEMEINEDLALLELGEDVYEYYTKHVKGNRKTSLDQARRKLTRNVLVAKVNKYDETGSTGFQHCYYGNLEIVVMGNKIVWLKNHTGGRSSSWFMKYLNKDLYKMLTKKLGIIS